METTPFRPRLLSAAPCHRPLHRDGGGAGAAVRAGGKTDVSSSLRGHRTPPAPGPFRRSKRFDGFDIRIRPRANLVRSDRHCAYGIVTTATRTELARLDAHARDVACPGW
jgi:hypothetical protein